MRTLSIVIALGSVATLAVCGSEDDAAPPPTTATPSVEVIAPEPAHDGTVVMAGEHPVEVVAHESGEVYAFVHGDAPPPGRVDIEVEVTVEDGGTRTVELDWHRGRERWEGQVQNVVLVPGPVDVHLHIDSHVWHGHVATFVVAPAIVVEVEIEEHHHDVRVHTHRKHHKHRKHRDHRKHRKHGKHRKHRDHGHIEVRIR
jgi:hypothetical protein